MRFWDLLEKDSRLMETSSGFVVILFGLYMLSSFLVRMAIYAFQIIGA